MRRPAHLKFFKFVKLFCFIIIKKSRCIIIACVLKLTDLCKEYQRGENSFMAVNHVNLSVNAGDFVNIIGRSGSGKSTLLNMAAGMLTPTAGVVELDGENFANKNDFELSRIRNKKIGFIPQGASALPNLTVLENVLLPFYLWPDDIKNKSKDVEDFAHTLLERLEVLNLANSYSSELSGGELRRVLIARALINKPEIVIADEPTSDLDVESSQNIMKIFKSLNDEGITLLIVSHDLDTLKYGSSVYTMTSGVLSHGNKLLDV